MDEDDDESRKRSKGSLMEREEEGTVNGGYVVAGVVRNKMLFDTYPKSIMR